MARRHTPSSRAAVSRRHGRRPIRSALTGPMLPPLIGRVQSFELSARSAIEYLQSEVGSELAGVRFAMQSMPQNLTEDSTSRFWLTDRANQRITLFRVPIQRADVLHMNDAEHRNYFVQHCVYRAVCDYLGREPWELLPGQFDHF